MLHAAAQTFSADARFSSGEESSSLQKENVMSAQPIEAFEISPARARQSQRRPLATVPEWKKRPAELRPFGSFAEAVGLYEAARHRCLTACKARMALSAPFIESGPNTATIALSFSRSIDEAVAKCPDIPADLVAACREEEAATAAHRTIRRRLVQTPAHGADILTKLTYITQEFDNCLTPADWKDAYRSPEQFALSFEFYAVHDDIVRALQIADDEPAVRQMWEKAVTAFSTARAVHAATADDDIEAYERTADLEVEAEGGLMRTPVPDIVALAEKMRLSLRYLVEDTLEEDIDDPRSIAAALASGDSADREQILIYQDTLRLAGLRPEIVGVTPFDPQPFVEAAESQLFGLRVVEDSEDGRLVIRIDGDVSDDMRDALASLRQTERRALREALKLSVSKFRGAGAEPSLMRSSGPADPWAAKLERRNAVVDLANAVAVGEGGEAKANEILEEVDALEESIDTASSHEPQALAAKIRLMVKRWEEGFETSPHIRELAMRAADRLAPLQSSIAA